MKITSKNARELARRRKRRAGGRPSRQTQEINRLAAELAKKYLEDWLKPILDTYLSLACGQKVGRVKRKLDPATCRHCVERFVAPAPRTMNLELVKTAEDFYEKIMQGAGEHDDDKPEGEPEGEEKPPPKGKLH